MSLLTNRIIMINNHKAELRVLVDEEHMARVISVKKVYAVAEKMGWLTEEKNSNSFIYKIKNFFYILIRG